MKLNSVLAQAALPPEEQFNPPARILITGATPQRALMSSSLPR